MGKKNPAAGATPMRQIQLRDERLTTGVLSALWAWIGSEGELHLDGQDLGPLDWVGALDGEYEYHRTIAPEDFPALITMLGGQPDDDVLALLARDHSGMKSFRMELSLRDAPFPTRLYVH